MISLRIEATGTSADSTRVMRVASSSAGVPRESRGRAGVVSSTDAELVRRAEPDLVEAAVDERAAAGVVPFQRAMKRPARRRPTAIEATRTPETVSTVASTRAGRVSVTPA